MILLLIILLLVLIFIGIPIGFSLIASSLVFILYSNMINLETLPQRLFSGLDSYPLLAIPLFILAGGLMNSGGITQRLIDLSQVLVGHIRGNLAQVTVVSNMFMSGISGSGAADAAATGSVLGKTMVSKGYGKGFASAILGASATIGPIIPPSIPMVVYGSIAGASIGQLFIGGAIPGIMMGIGLMITAYIIARKRNLEKSKRASLKQFFIAFKNAFWALLMPVVIVGGILSGWFSATEAAMVAVVYALIIGIFVYKDLKWKDLPEKLMETLMLSSVIGIIIAAASPFGWIMAFEQAPLKVIEMFQSISGTPWVIMLLIMIVLLIMGMFLEGTAIIIITTPVLLPLITQIGIDPVHFGVLLAINTMIGTITPPVGVIMYITNSLTGATVLEFVKEIMPFLIVLTMLLLLFTYVPELVMFLPDLLSKG